MSELSRRSILIGVPAAAAVAYTGAAVPAASARPADEQDDAEHDRILIRGGHVLTMDPAIGDLPDADVLVHGDRIVDVGERLRAGGARVIDATGALVLPGLIDGHRHSWQSLLHGLASDWGVARYMREVRGGYGGVFTASDAYLGNYVGGLESIASGITTVLDHSQLQTSTEITEALLRGSWDSGVAGWFAYAFQNTPDWLERPPADAAQLAAALTGAPDAHHDEAFAAARRLLTELDPAGSGRLRLGAAGHETLPVRGLNGARTGLDRIRAAGPDLLTLHWGGGARGQEAVLPTLVNNGAFTVPTVLSHGNQMVDAELDAVARGGLGLASTPDTEMGMIGDPMITGRMLDRGISPALGIDTTCYVSADLFASARGLVFETRRQRRPITPRKALELLTVDASRAVGAADTIGTLTPGKRADLAVVRPDQVRTRPVGDPAAALLLYGGANVVDTVLVAGRSRKRSGRLVGVEPGEIADRVARARSRIQRRYEALPSAIVAGSWGDLF